MPTEGLPGKLWKQDTPKDQTEINIGQPEQRKIAKIGEQRRKTGYKMRKCAKLE